MLLSLVMMLVLALVTTSADATASARPAASPAAAAPGATPTPTPQADTTPLLTYAATQKLAPLLSAIGEAASRKKVERIQFNLSKDPPPEEDCAQTLGAKRFSLLLQDLGEAYSSAGDDAAAADAYRKAINCNPRAEFLHAQLAAALLDLNRYTEARAETQRELTLGRGNFELHTLMTQLDFIDHRWTEAAANARLAVTEAPDDEQATYWQCFLWLAQLHSHIALPALADRRPTANWPAPILETLQGTRTEAGLVKAVAAEHNLKRRREILTEALFYVGEQRLADNHPDEALRYFTATTALQVKDFIEHHLAAAELEKLRGAGTDQPLAGPYLPRAPDNVFIACQLLHAHRTAGVKTVGRNTNLRSHAELTAVGKLRRGVV